MKSNYQFDIRSWDEKTQKDIFRADKRFFELLDAGVNRQDQFMHVSYDFASYILQGGQFYLPDGVQGSSPYRSEDVTRSLKNFIGDNVALIPFGIVKNGHLEVFWDAKSRIIPRGQHVRGGLCGLRTFAMEPKDFNFKHTWTITSGSRTLILLPSIKDIGRFKRIKRHYNIQSELPKDYLDHWHIFKGIYESVEPCWKTDVIFFSDKMIKRMRVDKAFSNVDPI